MPRILIALLLTGLVSACSSKPTTSDGGAADASADDSGMVDAGSPDAGGDDAGPVDAGVDDAGSIDAGVDAGPLNCAEFNGYYLYRLANPCQGNSRESAALCVAQNGCQVTVSTPEGTLTGTATFTDFTASSANETLTAMMPDGGPLSLHATFADGGTTCDDTADQQYLPLLASSVCCDVVAQDCGGGQLCSIVDEGTGEPRTTACLAPEGMQKLEQTCTRPGNQVGHDDCEPGLFCSQLAAPSAIGPVCRTLCRSDADCGAAKACLSLDSTPPGGVCLPSCTFFGTDCLGDTTCRLQRSLATDPTATGVGVCSHVGTLGMGDPCGGAAQCPANMDCAKGPNEVQPSCRPYCDANHSCLGTNVCQPQPNTRAGVSIGICMPM